MNDNMVEWKKLGEIMQIARGASPRPIKNYITSDEDGVNWIKIGDVSPNDKYITKTNEKITKEGASKSRLLHSGDFVLSNSMSFGRPYILKIDGCIHDGWIFMSGYKNSVIAGYLYEVLNSDFVQKYWRTKANNGGAMTNLNSDIVRATSIPIPSLSEQNRIVGILDTFTDSIENLKQQIAQRRKQYEHYRDQLLTNVDREETNWKELSEIADLYKGTYVTKKESNEGAFPVVMGGQKVAYYIDKYNSEGESIVISRSGINAGYVSFWNQPIFVSDGYRIDTNEKVIKKYLFYFLKSREGQINSSKKGAGVPHIQSKYLLSILVPLPPLSEQQRIVSILDTFEASISNLEAQLEQRQKQYEYYRNKLLSFEKEEQ